MSQHREARKQSHNEEEKRLKKLYRELRTIWEAQRGLGWVELEKPIQRGYERVVVPRADYLKRADADFFIKLAEIVNNTVVSRDKKFLKKNYQTNKWEEMHAEPKKLDEKEYKALPEKFQREFFETIETHHHSWGNFTSTRKVYILDRQWRFTEKTQKHFMTRVRLRDADLDRREAEIENYLNTTNQWEKIWKIYGSHRKSYWDSEWERRCYEAQKRVVMQEVDEEVMRYSLEKYGA